MRQFLYKHSFVIGVIAVAITLACILVPLLSSSKAASILPQRNRAYFYDTTTNQIVEVPDNLIPPVTRSGHELVTAMVYACKSCSDASDRALGFLKTYTPERKQAEETTRKGLAPGEELPIFEVNRLKSLGGVLIRAADGEAFVAADSTEGEAIMGKVASRCPTLMECKPF